LETRHQDAILPHKMEIVAACGCTRQKLLP
jgi:hypothetical protein